MLKKLLYVLTLCVSISYLQAQSDQPPCKKQIDIAEVIRGTYDVIATVSTFDKEVKQKKDIKATLTVVKTVEDKVRVSLSEATSTYELKVERGGPQVVGGNFNNSSIDANISLLLQKPGVISGRYNQALPTKAGEETWWFEGQANGKPESIPDPNEPFIAKTKSLLECHLDNLKGRPEPVTFNGDLYRSIKKKLEVAGLANVIEMSDYQINNDWGRYDVKGTNERALYFSQTLEGNQTEVSAYGPWEESSTYKFENVTITNLLDLTNSDIASTLGVLPEDLVASIDSKSESLMNTDEKTLTEKGYNYEFANVIGTWARKKQYKGIIAYGARGNKDYINVVIFGNITIKTAFNRSPPIKLK